MPNSPKETRDKQIAAGKLIAMGMLGDLAVQLDRPEIADVSFTERTFDEPELIFLTGRSRRVVGAVLADQLADAPTTASTRQELRNKLRTIVDAYQSQETEAESGMVQERYR